MISEEDKAFLREAIRLSIENVNEDAGGPFGAVIVKDGEIIAKGSNKVTVINDPTAHAEVMAIRNACAELEDFNLEGCTIYTSCEPCPMCLSAIYWARVERIVYANSRQDAAAIGFDDNFLYNEIPKPLEERNIPIEQTLADEAIKAFKLWEKDDDKVHY
ncbi:MAG: nucleoside deaminase [Bacteroidota bacterium]